MKWQFSSAYSNMAFCQLKLDQNYEAINTLDYALDFKPVSENIYLLFEIVYRRLGEENKANEYKELYFEKIRAIGITECEAYENSADWKYDLGNIDDAILDYERVLTYQPDNNNLIEKLGDLSLQKCDTLSAIDRYLKILENDELSYSINYKLANLYIAKKDTLSALHHYTNLSKIDTIDLDVSISELINQLQNN
jgi:tetratricopeptide (TPR) repeat protein